MDMDMDAQGSSIDSSKDAFLGLLASLDNPDEILSFETFVGAAIEERLQMLQKEYDNNNESKNQSSGQDQEHDHQHHAGCSHGNSNNKENQVARSAGSKIFKLNKIIEDLRARLPVTAEAPNEQITIPETEEFEGYSRSNVVHVDSFLYTEDDVDDLCDQGKLSRNFCLKCQSKETRPLNFISHSATVVQLQFLFQVLLRGEKSKGKTILDIGSRLGAVLYSGYLFTDAQKLIGVEMNDYFCKLQNDIVRKHRLQDRVEIIHDNLLNRASTVQSADIIIMNNVFQFFAPVHVQRQLWEFLYNQLAGKRKGVILITIPALQDQLKDAGLVGPVKKQKSAKGRKVPAKPPAVLAAEKAAAASKENQEGESNNVGNWTSWLREVEINVTGAEFVEDIMEDELEDLKLIHMYEVI